jgi:hypothetical protein
MPRLCLIALMAALSAGIPARVWSQDAPAEKSAGQADPAAKAEAKPEAKSQAKPEADKPQPSAEESALRDALKALAKALQEGDRDGLRRAMFAANATERKMLDAMAGMAAQIAELHKASAKAFGEEEAKGLTGDVAMEMGRIDEAEVSFDGDTATVRYAPPPATPAASTEGEADAPPAPPPLVLKKVDGRWRVPVAELSKDTTPAEIEQRLTDLEAQTKIIAELSAEIAQGKYKSAEKAAEAWQGKMMQALTPRKGDAANKAEGEPGKAGEEQNKPDAAKPN